MKAMGGKSLVHLAALVITAPLGLMALADWSMRRSEGLFSAFAQCLALVPGKTGSFLRIAYYRWTLAHCDPNGAMGFGSFCAHPQAKICRGVYIGAYCIIGRATIEADVTIGSGVHILSGRYQHRFDEIDTPIQHQGRSAEQITIGANSWIGNSAVVMADIGVQTVVGAASVVVKRVEDYSVVAGNPARLLRKLK